MKKILFLLIIPTLFCTGLLLNAPKTKADVNDFTVNNFVADYYLDNTDKQGSMRVKEQIDVTFTDNNHGIERALPESYKKHKLDITNIKTTKPDGSSWPYTTRKSNGNLVLKIGDPNNTVTGVQTFIIEYTEQNVMTFYNDHDELYWDINGDQWKQTFLITKANFHLPSELKIKELRCFTGAYQTATKDCTITDEGNGTVVAVANVPLQATETLTAIMSVPKGYFAPLTFKDWLKENLLNLILALGPPLVMGIWAYRKWLKDGRDIKGRGVIVAQYSPPDNLSPAEAGVIMDYKLDTKDITATLIDLAVRKYIRIIEIREKKFLHTDTKYEFELLKTDFSSLRSHEETIMSGIFSTLKTGEKVKLDSLKDKYYETVKSLQDDVPDALVTAGYMPDASGTAKLGMGAGAFALMFAGAIIRHFIGIGLVLSAAILGIFALLMPKRTAKGVEAKEHLEGLKLYINTAEKDRIKMMQTPNSPYASDHDAPKRTADLYEKLLPYAIVFGCEKQWSQEFKDIYTTPPDWYSGGNWATFNAVYFSSSLANSMSAMNTSFSPPSSSGSSGFGGGGFSGGGGGGGGGGGW